MKPDLRVVQYKLRGGKRLRIYKKDGRWCVKQDAPKAKPFLIFNIGAKLETVWANLIRIYVA